MEKSSYIKTGIGFAGLLAFWLHDANLWQYHPVTIAEMITVEAGLFRVP